MTLKSPEEQGVSDELTQYKQVEAEKCISRDGLAAIGVLTNAGFFLFIEP